MSDEPYTGPRELGEIADIWVPTYRNEFERQFAEKEERFRAIREQVDEANRLFSSMGKPIVYVTQMDIARYVGLRLENGDYTEPS